MQRDDYITFHEPFTDACYFGPERTYSYYDNQLSEYPQYLDTTFSKVIDKILKAAANEEKKNIFIKDMPRHIVRPHYNSHPENPTMLPIDFLKRCTHTFLIRTPQKAVPSNYRGFLGVNKEFIPEDMGYPELQALFEFLTQLTGTRPAVVDAGDLVTEPTAIMRVYCESGINDRFEPSMLEWKSERVPAFDKWPGWHDEAQDSTGFNQVQKTKDKKDDLVLPEDVQQLIEQSMPIYEAMREFRICV